MHPIRFILLDIEAREYGFHTTLMAKSMVINDSPPEHSVNRAMHILNRYKNLLTEEKFGIGCYLQIGY